MELQKSKFQELLINVIQEDIHNKNVFIMLSQDNNCFQLKCNTNQLNA